MLFPASNRDWLLRSFWLLPADFGHSPESSGAYFKADPALNTIALIYYVYHSFIASDVFAGTISQTDKAALALLRDDIIGDKVFAYPGRALFLIDMCFILVTKVSNSGQYRVGCSPAQGTK
jgi:hypothetical protein